MSDSAEAIVARLRGAARPLGWAITTHGSMVRDIDVVAVPWVDEAASVDALVRTLAGAIGYEAEPRELAAAQGFAASYVLPRVKRRATYFIGHSVPPDVMAAIARANAAVRRAEVA